MFIIVYRLVNLRFFRHNHQHYTDNIFINTTYETNLDKILYEILSGMRQHEIKIRVSIRQSEISAVHNISYNTNISIGQIVQGLDS